MKLQMTAILLASPLTMSDGATFANACVDEGALAQAGDVIEAAGEAKDQTPFLVQVSGIKYRFETEEAYLTFIKQEKADLETIALELNGKKNIKGKFIVANHAVLEASSEPMDSKDSKEDAPIGIAAVEYKKLDNPGAVLDDIEFGFAETKSGLNATMKAKKATDPEIIRGVFMEPGQNELEGTQEIPNLSLPEFLGRSLKIAPYQLMGSTNPVVITRDMKKLGEKQYNVSTTYEFQTVGKNPISHKMSVTQILDFNSDQIVTVVAEHLDGKTVQVSSNLGEIKVAIPAK